MPHPSSAAARAADELRRRIVEGELRAGAPLREEALSAELGISRNTLREGFSLLVALGLVVRTPNRGCSVRVPDARDVRDLYRDRRAIEVGTLVQPYVDPSALVGMRAAVERGRAGAEAGDEHETASANQEFHRGVVALAGSRRLSRHMETLLAEMRLVFASTHDDPEFHPTYVVENDRICTLAEHGRREEAAAVMRAYLLSAEDSLSARFGRAR